MAGQEQYREVDVGKKTNIDIAMLHHSRTTKYVLEGKTASAMLKQDKLK